jgi:hypothetical protein
VPIPNDDKKIEGVLRRSDLIALASRAADAAAAGRGVPSEVAKAEGRRFEILIPFGCEGSVAEDSNNAMQWRYEEDARTLRVRATPTSWSVRDWWPGSDAGPQDIEAIEGFWISRPWTGSESCPAAGSASAMGTDAITLPGQTLALAQFFTADGARQGRRDGKPFETVTKAQRDDVPGRRGFRLRLTGRIAKVPGSAPVMCHQPAGPEQRPICVIGTTVDEVTIENPVTDDRLATWSTDRKSSESRR